MVATTAYLPARLTIAQLHDRFLTILPRIETHARIYFRGIRCPHRKADRIAETIALAFEWFRRLVQRGMDPTMRPNYMRQSAPLDAAKSRPFSGHHPIGTPLITRAVPPLGRTGSHR
jgi:hypothetical protein